MLKEVVEKYPQDQVSVHVVWMPMVPGDDEQAARSTGEMYAKRGVHQYYDDEHILGLAYRSELFANCLRDILTVMPSDHPMYAEISEWASSSHSEGPLWDAVLFYPPGVEWTERMPRPVAWSKQVGFFGSDAGDVTGVFFQNDCKQLPVDSDWRRQVREAMPALIATTNRNVSTP